MLPGPVLGIKTGPHRADGHQVSPRGGVVKVRVDGPRVALIGQAVTVLRGELLGLMAGQKAWETRL